MGNLIASVLVSLLSQPQIQTLLRSVLKIGGAWVFSTVGSTWAQVLSALAIAAGVGWSAVNASNSSGAPSKAGT